MKVSDYIVKFIKEYNVDTIFGYQGGMITHLVDSIFKEDGINFVSLYHEQGAAFAAEGYSRVSGNIGVAIATSGPGATNLVTGIASCFFDSIACIFITGQVNTYELRRNDNIRQEGFQETDIIKIVQSITKYSVSIKNAEDIKYHLEKAFFLAKNERCGPVLLDIPMNIQRAEVNEDELKGFYYTDEHLEMEKYILNEVDLNNDIQNVINLIKESSRPIILSGGGIRIGRAIDELKLFSVVSNIPVVTTLMGLDSIDSEHENYVGYMGSYGNRYSNLAVANSDLLIVLGSRLTTRQTSTNVKSFAREAKIIHVDIDNNELNLKLKEDISIRCDVKVFLTKIINKLNIDDYKYDFSIWMDKIKNYKKQYPSYPTKIYKSEIDPNEIMHFIGDLCNKNTIFSLDIGQNQIWASQSIAIKKGQRVLNAGGMGPMGFSIPAAIGAWYSSKKSKIISIVGDGGFQMNIQELQTIIRDNIPIKIIIMNNQALGMIRHFQELYYDSKYYGTIEGYSTPDFIKVCTAYGIDSTKISSIDEIHKIKELLDDDKSHLIEITLSQITYSIPKLEMGRPIEDQSPLLDRDEFYKNMIVKAYK
ncbi:thiamine pyrophosphate-binding protein [Romboutsia sp.]|uniref:thiamine pyrophosphate-binding protein n=1 Tax=Romboutsia sp. TaxID=1965302 RepID=UPI003F34A4E5